MKQTVFNVIISLVVGALGIMQYLGYPHNEIEKETPVEVVEIKPTFFSKSPKEGLIEALEYYDIKHPDIVYAQAVLETGHFESNLCLNSNNLFGLYNSRKGEYYKFEHWTQSVKAYADFIQYRYKPPDDYYKFLSNIGYAEDPNYINKLKQIIKINNDKRRHTERDIRDKRV